MMLDHHSTPPVIFEEKWIARTRLSVISDGNSKYCRPKPAKIAALALWHPAKFGTRLYPEQDLTDGRVRFILSEPAGGRSQPERTLIRFFSDLNQ